MSKLTVISSNPNQKGGFVTKMSGEVSVKDPIFGDKKTKVTFYISAPNQIKEGTEIAYGNIFPMYKVAEHQMINPATGEAFDGKWLHLNAVEVMKRSIATA